MEINLGNLLCIYCNSSELQCIEWFPGMEPEHFEEWSLEDKIADYTQENFEAGHETVILIRCKKCSQWFQLDVKTGDIAIQDTPISPDLGSLGIPILEIEPFIGEPKALFLYGFRFNVIESIFRQKSIRYRKIGPFYPYPTGSYSLACTFGNSGSELAWFKCKVHNFGGPSFVSKRQGDNDFFQFHFEWVDSNGIMLLQSLSKNTRELRLSGLRNAADLYKSKYRKIINEEEIELLVQVTRNPEDLKILLEKNTHAANSARNLQAYRFINWFENELREYVWNIYLNKYQPKPGSRKWWKGSFSKNVINNIESSMSKERKLGNNSPSFLPIYYADFDDLMQLIEKEWQYITANTGTEIRVARGHFEYVKHFRNSVAHSRPLSHNDIMELQDNATRFSTLIGANLFHDMPFPFYQRPQIFD